MMLEILCAFSVLTAIVSLTASALTARRLSAAERERCLSHEKRVADLLRLVSSTQNKLVARDLGTYAAMQGLEGGHRRPEHTARDDESEAEISRMNGGRLRP
jgi:hypothetical protein